MVTLCNGNHNQLSLLLSCHLWIWLNICLRFCSFSLHSAEYLLRFGFWTVQKEKWQTFFPYLVASLSFLRATPLPHSCFCHGGNRVYRFWLAGHDLFGICKLWTCPTRLWFFTTSCIPGLDWRCADNVSALQEVWFQQKPEQTEGMAKLFVTSIISHEYVWWGNLTLTTQ